MVDTQFLQTLSVVIASTSLTIAAIYYISTLRNTVRARQAAIFSSLQSKMDTPEFWEYYIKIVWEYRSLSYEEYMEQVFSDQKKTSEVMSVISTFNHIGWLVKMGLLDIMAVTGLTFDPITVYDVIMPLLIRFGEEQGRSQEGGYQYYTYLYERIKKRRSSMKPDKYYQINTAKDKEYIS